MTTQRHPVRGAFAGLLLGFGMALMLIMLGVIDLTVTWLAIISILGLLLGIVFAFLTPTRHRPKISPTSSD